jgi:hypothetical protein
MAIDADGAIHGWGWTLAGVFPSGWYGTWDRSVSVGASQADYCVSGAYHDVYEVFCSRWIESDTTWIRPSSTWTALFPAGVVFRRLDLVPDGVCGLTVDDAVYCSGDIESTGLLDVPRRFEE